MRGLITDRTQQNVLRRSTLSRKGWSAMTTAERSEWLGDPMDVVGANLLPFGPAYSSVVDLKTTNSEIVATALSGGIYLYSILIIGDAKQYENKTFTLSAEYINIVGGGTPQLAMYWHDENGYEYAGGTLFDAGSLTFNTADFPNTNNREYLAVYVYVTTDATVASGAVVRFGGVMLEVGRIRHPYVPYTEIAPTNTTKGAYNYSDLNRVERAVAEISEIDGLGLVTKTDWAMWDIPTESEMNRYLGNIKTIRDSIGSTIALPDSMNNLTYETANNIEKILLAASTTITAG